jgi:hypothetical protein
MQINCFKFVSLATEIQKVVAAAIVARRAAKLCLFMIRKVHSSGYRMSTMASLRRY